MPTMSIDRDRLNTIRAAEAERFLACNPRSATLADQARDCLYGGVPMHWMADWSTPVPLFVDAAQGARFTDVDGHDYVDFCLGDTGAMCGHSPAPIARVLRDMGASGYTTMLPGEASIDAGRLLAERFGLPYWQFATTASDANRWVLRWVRAITGRSKILVFDGCYHGAVDDTLVRLQDGRTKARAGMLGQVYDLAEHTRVVAFNDLPALEAALAGGDIAAVLCEPALTNIGMVLPDEGFHEAMRALTRAHGTLLILDETHTVSSGPGGYTVAHGLEPDFLVMGKPIAGGLPASAYGCTAAMADAMRNAHARASDAGGDEHGHSGMGTTLSANVMTMRCIAANLSEVMTEAAYAAMIPRAERLADGLRALFARHAMPWCVTQVGTRCEFQFCAVPPRTGAEAEAAFDTDLEQALHLFLLNRGVMITPFHNMMLVCPDTTDADVAALLAAIDDALTALTT